MYYIYNHFIFVIVEYYIYQNKIIIQNYLKEQIYGLI